MKLFFKQIASIPDSEPPFKHQRNPPALGKGTDFDHFITPGLGYGF
jgi:hypothetical protein